MFATYLNEPQGHVWFFNTYFGVNDFVPYIEYMLAHEFPRPRLNRNAIITVKVAFLYVLGWRNQFRGVNWVPWMGGAY